MRRHQAASVLWSLAEWGLGDLPACFVGRAACPMQLLRRNFSQPEDGLALCREALFAWRDKRCAAGVEHWCGVGDAGGHRWS